MAEKTRELAIITFNTLGTPFMRGHQKKNYLDQTLYLLKRFRKLATLLNESEADVIALQEVHLYPLLFFLRRNLTNYPFFFYKPFVYGPRGGMVLFSKQLLTDCEYIDFTKHGSFRNKSFIFKITQNGMLIAKVSGSPVYILNTTVSADADHDWTSLSKYHSLAQLQLKQIAHQINRLGEKGAVILAVGDFNMAQDSSLYTDFKEKTGAVNMFSAYEIPTQHPDFLPEDLESSPRLDYVFVKSLTKVISVKVRHMFREKLRIGKKEMFLSDHPGLWLLIGIVR